MPNSPWRYDENGLRFHIEVPSEYGGVHRNRYLTGYFKGFLRRFNKKPATPQSQRRQGESRLSYRLRSGQQ
jgi:hypothetical protein